MVQGPRSWWTNSCGGFLRYMVFYASTHGAMIMCATSRSSVLRICFYYYSDSESACAACTSPPGLFGWHLSYAMSTESIRRKLRAFSHAKDGFVLETLKRNDSYFDKVVESCTNLFRRKTVTSSCSANYLPPVGWPSHPVAPRSTLNSSCVTTFILCVMSAARCHAVTPMLQSVSRFCSKFVGFCGMPA